MTIITCLIAVYTLVDGNLKKEHDRYVGVYKKQDEASSTFLVDFSATFETFGIDTKYNNKIQWVHGNECLFGNFIKKEKQNE